MDGNQLDRAIDVAARELMAREPSGALTRNVLARVQRPARPSPQRFVWATAAAGAAVAVSAILLMNPAPLMIPALPAVQPLPVQSGVAAVTTPMGVATETTQARRAVRPRVAFNLSRTIAPDDTSSIEPMETPALAVASLEVPQLNREATVVIETLDIDPLTIEPLSASND